MMPERPATLLTDNCTLHPISAMLNHLLKQVYLIWMQISCALPPDDIVYSLAALQLLFPSVEAALLFHEDHAAAAC